MLFSVMASGVNMHRETKNRRDFLKLTAAGVGISLSSGCGTFSRGRKKSSGRRKPEAGTAPPKALRMGFIGVGGSGNKNLQAFSARGIEIVALCDVDTRELYRARDAVSEKHPSIRLYKDFRIMLANAGALDAVVISTPDHAHGMQAVHALRSGCHVFLETPLVHTLKELSVLEQETKEARRIVMPGDCGCQHEEALRAREVLSTGVLGDILQVHIWTNRPVWPQGGDAPSGSDPVPENLDWQLWLSGAKPRPYKRFVYHKFNWRGWTDFGCGALGDIGCRLLGFPFKVLNLDAPHEFTRIYHVGGTELSYPKSTELRISCESGNQKKDVELFWYDGYRMPRIELLSQVKATLGKIPGTGTLIVGERGSWFVSGTECEQHYMGINGAVRMTDLEKHELWSSAPKFLPRTGTPHDLFLRTVRNSKGYDFEVNADKALNQAILGGTISQRLEGTVNWNGRKECFIKNEAANALLAPYIEESWRYY